MAKQSFMGNGRENNRNGKLSSAGAMINPSFVPDDDSNHQSFPHSNTQNTGTKGAEIKMQDIGDYSQNFEDDEYNPYDNRDVARPTTNSETLIHLLKGSLGTGILAMPCAFSRSGYILGIIGTIVIGLICTYCIHMLVNAEYELCRRRKIPKMTYPEVAVAAMQEGPVWCQVLAPYCGTIVNVFLLIYQLGTCCVYVVFINENLKSVIITYGGSSAEIKICMAGVFVALVLINCLPNLKMLAPFSQAANLATFVSFLIILYYICRDGFTMEGKVAIGKVENFPLFFGTVLFALEAIGVILPLENEMKTPECFGSKFGVLNKAMLAIISLYVLMGLLGYIKYGNEALGSITLNLPSDTEIAAQVVQILLAMAIYITHGLACYVAIDIIWNQYISKQCKHARFRVFYEYLIRFALVLGTYLLAITIPALDLFISLFGAFGLSALGLAFPAVIEISTYWNHLSTKEYTRMMIKNGIIILIGVLGLITGTYASVKGIVKEFS